MEENSSLRFTSIKSQAMAAGRYSPKGKAEEVRYYRYRSIGASQPTILYRARVVSLQCSVRRWAPLADRPPRMDAAVKELGELGRTPTARTDSTKPSAQVR